MQVKILVLILLIILVFGCIGFDFKKLAETDQETPKTIPTTPAQKTKGTENSNETTTPITPQKTPEVDNEQAKEPDDKLKPLPEKSIAIFYRTALSEVADRLPVSVTYTNTSGGYATNIRWESTEKGIVRYIPAVSDFEVMATTRSTSYSKSSIAPLTINSRLFSIITRSTSTSINELDPKTAKLKKSIPVEGSNFAIVGDNVFYRETIQTNIYDKRTSGGELMSRSLVTGQAKEVLAYGDPDNSGKLYSAGNALLSVVYDPETKSDTIRQHDPSTGRVTKVLQTGIPTGKYVSGSNALYQYVSDGGKTYWVNQYHLDGEAKVLLEVDLEEGEKGISIDEDQGKLLVVVYGNNFKVKEIYLRDIATGNLEEVSFESFGSGSEQDYQFLFLN